MRFSSSLLLLPVAAAVSVALVAPAKAQFTQYFGSYSGANQVPVNASTGTGTITVTILSPTSLLVNLSFSGLSAPVSAAHIHQGAPGANGPVVIPFSNFTLGTTSGTYSNTFTDSGNGVISGVITDLSTNARPYYANIHSTSFPGGEIRANLAPAPEAGTGLLALAGIGTAAGIVLRRRSK